MTVALRLYDGSLGAGILQKGRSSKRSSAEITHRITADTGQLVAAGGFDEGKITSWTRSLDCCGSGSFDGGSEGDDEWFVARVRIVPGFLTF